MDGNTVIIYLACFIVIFIVGKIFFVPLKKISKVLLNSVLGGLSIYILNLVGVLFNFHLGLNCFTSIFTGLLGIPRGSYFNINKVYVGIRKHLNISLNEVFR